MPLKALQKMYREYNFAQYRREPSTPTEFYKPPAKVTSQDHIKYHELVTEEETEVKDIPATKKHPASKSYRFKYAKMDPEKALKGQAAVIKKLSPNNFRFKVVIKNK